jgi:hypothetical protein
MKPNYLFLDKYLYKNAMRKEKSNSSQTTENSSLNQIRSIPNLNQTKNQIISMKKSLSKSISSFVNKKNESYNTRSLQYQSSSKGKTLFSNYIKDSLPKVKPIRIKLKPTVEDVQKEILHNLSHSINYKPHSPGKRLDKQIKYEISLLDSYNPKNVVGSLITLKHAEKKIAMKQEMSHPSNIASIKRVPTLNLYMKNTEFNDAILSVNPMINYQRMIEDPNILYIFHNENTKKLRKCKHLRYLD